MADDAKKTQKQVAQKYKDHLDYYRRPHSFRRAKLIVFLAAVVISLGLAFGFNTFVGEKKAEVFFNTGPVSRNHANLAQGCQACHWGATPDFAHLIQLNEVIKDMPRETNQAITKIRTALLQAKGAGTSVEDRAKGLLTAYSDLSALEKMDVACIACHVQLQLLPVSLHCPQPANLQLAKFTPEMHVVESGTCSTCHREHEGPGPMTLPASERACAICHNDRKKMEEILVSNKGGYSVPVPNATPVLSAQNYKTPEGITRFLVPKEPGSHMKPFRTYSEDHPPFDYETVKLARDTASIRYNHARHEQPDVIGKPSDKANTNQGKPMACTTCHEPGADGRYMQQVSFAKHCERCHTLDIELTDVAPTLTIKVPHRDPEKVKAYLTNGNLTAKFRDDALNAGHINPVDQDQIAKDGYGSLARKGMRTLEDIHKRVFWTGDPPQDESGRQRILGKKALAACVKCHDMDPPRASMYRGIEAPKMVPTKIVDRWVNHGPFNHAPHRHMRCEDCHADEKFTIVSAKKSQSTSDILMPRQKLCAECHRPAGEAVLEKIAAADPSEITAESTVIEKDSERAARQRREGGILWDCQDCHKFHAPAEALKYTPGLSSAK
ncbi:MAG: hypothetical protein ABI680_01910 [Chthoniobacteraceae bacterium]